MDLAINPDLLAGRGTMQRRLPRSSSSEVKPQMPLLSRESLSGVNHAPRKLSQIPSSPATRPHTQSGVPDPRERHGPATSCAKSLPQPVPSPVEMYRRSARASWT